MTKVLFPSFIPEPNGTKQHTKSVCNQQDKK